MANLNEIRSEFFQKSIGTINVTTKWIDLSRKDLFLRDVYLCADFIFGDGKRIRASTDLISVTNSDGKQISYEPLLSAQPSISASYSLGTGTASQRTFSLTIDARKINPLDIILNSGQFLSGICEISLQSKDGSFEDRYIIMIGDMIGGIQFATDNEFIQIEIGDPVRSQDRIIPENILTKESFPNMPDNQVGQRLPIILDSNTCGVPCIRTTQYEYGPTFLIGYGHQIEVTNVFLNGNEFQSTDNQRGWSIIYDYTNDGIPYTGVDFVFPTTTEERTTYVTLPDMTTPMPLTSTVTLTGEPWRDNDSVYVFTTSKYEQRSVLELIKFLLKNYTNFGNLGVDETLFSRAFAKTPNLLAEFLINASSSSSTASTFSYIQQTVCGSFPMISLAFANGGIGPVFTDRRSSIIQGQFIVGQSEIIDRRTSFTESPKDKCFNSYTLRYGYNAMTDTYTKVVSRNPSSSNICRISADRIGLQERTQIDSVIIQDDLVASYVIEWLVDHNSLPSYYIEYDCTPNLYFLLTLGDNIQVTDPDLGFTSRIATIEKIEYQQTKVILGLRFWFLYENITRST